MTPTSTGRNKSLKRGASEAGLDDNEEDPAYSLPSISEISSPAYTYRSPASHPPTIAPLLLAAIPDPSKLLSFLEKDFLEAGVPLFASTRLELAKATAENKQLSDAKIEIQQLKRELQRERDRSPWYRFVTQSSSQPLSAYQLLCIVHSDDIDCDMSIRSRAWRDYLRRDFAKTSQIHVSSTDDIILTVDAFSIPATRATEMTSISDRFKARWAGMAAKLKQPLGQLLLCSHESTPEQERDLSQALAVSPDWIDSGDLMPAPIIRAARTLLHHRSSSLRGILPLILDCSASQLRSEDDLECAELAGIISTDKDNVTFHWVKSTRIVQIFTPRDNANTKSMKQVQKALLSELSNASRDYEIVSEQRLITKSSSDPHLASLYILALLSSKPSSGPLVSLGPLQNGTCLLEDIMKMRMVVGEVLLNQLERSAREFARTGM